ncbi:MAG: hypothetical protein DRI57_11785 [Deltaproteobacteria bacterium]|nr:MAG: hypothetical protein DRI57_11785 [Deltaproteobacteria bacterium]
MRLRVDTFTIGGEAEHSKAPAGLPNPAEMAVRIWQSEPSLRELSGRGGTFKSSCRTAKSGRDGGYKLSPIRADGGASAWIGEHLHKTASAWISDKQGFVGGRAGNPCLSPIRVDGGLCKTVRQVRKLSENG